VLCHRVQFSFVHDRKTAGSGFGFFGGNAESWDAGEYRNRATVAAKTEVLSEGRERNGYVRLAELIEAQQGTSGAGVSGRSSS
jgi:hypothetical protein